jgi:uncharacterized surface protein with fasciclin (FAS1) repeats
MKTILKSAVLLCVLVCFAGIGPALAAPPDQNIIEVVLAVNNEGPYAGQFDTLIAALLLAKPVVVNKLLGRGGKYTVFGPTDAAFETLGLNPGNIGEMSQKPLTDILLYHITKGRLYAEDVLDEERIKMLKGGFLLQNAGVLTDNVDRDATIIATDVEASNGVIHVIDRVVFPYLP